MPAPVASSTNRLLSLVAAAAVLPLLGLYGLLMYIATPSPTGGMEPTVTTVCYIAFTALFSALITVALNFSRQLSRQSQGKFETP
jgi:ABC-type Fe3+-siderophore transport system permease subunit